MKPLRSFNHLVGQAVRLGATDIHLASGLPPVYRLQGDLIASDFEWQTPESIERIIFYFFEWERRAKPPVDNSPLFSFPDNLAEMMHSERPAGDPFGDPFGDPLADLAPDHEPELGLSLDSGYDYRECPIYQSYLRDGQVCVISHLEWVGHFRFALYRERGALHAAVRVHPWNPPSLASLGWPEQFCPDFGLWTVLGHGRTTTLASLVEEQIRLGRPVHVFEQQSEYIFPKAASQQALGQDPDRWPAAVERLIKDLDASLELADSKALTVVVMDELRYPFHYELAAELLQRNCLILAGQAGSFSSDIRTHLRVQLSGDLGMFLRAFHTGIVSQKVVPLATGFGQIGAFCVYLSEVRDRMQTSYLGPSRKLSLEESLARLVVRGVVSTQDALRASQRPDELLIKLPNS